MTPVSTYELPGTGFVYFCESNATEMEKLILTIWYYLLVLVNFPVAISIVNEKMAPLSSPAHKI